MNKSILDTPNKEIVIKDALPNCQHEGLVKGYTLSGDTHTDNYFRCCNCPGIKYIRYN